MQKELDEILRKLTGNSQTKSSTQLSVPKKYALRTLEAFDRLANQNAKQSWTISIWKSLKWYVRNRVIPKKSDAEVRADLKVIYDELSPMFLELQKGKEVKESRILNSNEGQKTKAQEFVESAPDIQETLQLVEEL